jgi:TATA-box binding protein (TBP) (component of TFIID and TFIIIB)
MGEIKISTKTIIGVSNVECDIDKIYASLTVREMDEGDREKILCLISFKKQRGRRKKESDEVIEKKKQLSSLLIQPEEGDIVGLYFQNKQRGLPQFLKYNKKYFRNALNIIMVLANNKKVNFKLSKNGKIQMTGCKEDEDAKQCLEMFFHKLDTECSDAIRYDRAKGIEIYYYTVMTNIDFNTGFKINRQKLNVMINESTEFNSLLETSFGYTGVNIKIPMYLGKDIIIDRLSLESDDSWRHEKVSFVEFLNGVDESFRTQELTKKRYNTFLVFHSGNIIMSGMRLDKMLDLQKSFYNMLQQNREKIEELLI